MASIDPEASTSLSGISATSISKLENYIDPEILPDPDKTTGLSSAGCQQIYKKSTKFDVETFVGVLNNECQKNINIDRSQNVQIVEHQFNLYPPQSNNQNTLSHLNDIKQSFETLYSSELAWLKPVPWFQDLQFEPEEFYVELLLEELSRGGKLSKKASMQVENLLKPETGYRNSPKRILIRGEAGLGKTTMCLKIDYDWSKGKEGNLAETFELLLLFRLRDLFQNEAPEDSLVKFCHFNASKNVEETFTVDTLREVSDRILILLDGYDELNPCHTNALSDILKVKKEGFQSVFRNSTIIVTSRITENEEFFKLFQRHVRIVGLSEESKTQLVRNMFRDDEDRSTAVMNVITNYNDSFSSSMTPFILLLICYLYQIEGSQIEKSLTRSMVLHGVLLLMGEKCCDRLGTKKTFNEIESVFRKLGEFYLSREENEASLLFSKSEIKDLYTSEEEANLILQCGILMPSGSLNKNRLNQETLEPVHKIFLDYVCTSHLQYKFDCISGIQYKLSYVVTTLKCEVFSLRSEFSQVVFFTENSRFKGMEFFCVWYDDLEDVEMQICKGTFVVGDDDLYSKMLNVFKAVKKKTGEINILFERSKPITGSEAPFRGLQQFFPQFVKGREFLIALLETPAIGNIALVSLSDSKYEKDTEFNYNLKFNAEENDECLWTCELEIRQIKYFREQWCQNKESDSIRVIETFREDFAIEPTFDETEGNSVTSQDEASSAAFASNLNSVEIIKDTVICQGPLNLDKSLVDNASSNAGKRPFFKNIPLFKNSKFSLWFKKPNWFK